MATYTQSKIIFLSKLILNFERILTQGAKLMVIHIESPLILFKGSKHSLFISKNILTIFPPTNNHPPITIYLQQVDEHPFSSTQDYLHSLRQHK